MQFLKTNKNNNENYGKDSDSLSENGVAVAEILEEIKKGLLEKWKKAYAKARLLPAKIEEINPNVVDFLLSFDLVSTYDDIAKQAKLDEHDRNEMPHVVWELARTKKWDQAGDLLQAKTGADFNTCALLLQLLEERVLKNAKMLSEKPVVEEEVLLDAEKKEVQIPIMEALARYPKLGGQPLTANPLKLRYASDDLCRPSIKNWIKDFYEKMGTENHSNAERENYLYQSENAKKLTPLERQRVSVVLKSLEEDAPVSVDENNEILIFDAEKFEINKKEDNGNKPVQHVKSPIDLSMPPAAEAALPLKTRTDVKKEDFLRNFKKLEEAEEKEVSAIETGTKNVEKPETEKSAPEETKTEEKEEIEIKETQIEDLSVDKNNAGEKVAEDAGIKDEKKEEPFLKSEAGKNQIAEKDDDKKEGKAESFSKSKDDHKGKKSEMQIEHENYFSSFREHANNIRFLKNRDEEEKKIEKKQDFSLPEKDDLKPSVSPSAKIQEKTSQEAKVFSGSENDHPISISFSSRQKFPYEQEFHKTKHKRRRKTGHAAAPRKIEVEFQEKPEVKLPEEKEKKDEKTPDLDSSPFLPKEEHAPQPSEKIPTQPKKIPIASRWQIRPSGFFGDSSGPTGGFGSFGN